MSGQNGKNHGLMIHFQGAAGTVTGSQTIIRIREGTTSSTYNILMDAGSAMGEKESGITDEKIDTAIFTHPHTDHIGEGPLLLLKNPSAIVYIPEGSKKVNAAMMQDAWKFRQKSIELGILQTSEAQCRLWFGEIIKWERSLGVGRKKHTKMNRGGRKKQTLNANERSNLYREIEDSIEDYRTLIKAKIGNYYPEDDTTENINKAIEAYFQMEKKILKEKGIVTNEDVQGAIKRLEERTLKKVHTIFPKKIRKQPITFTMQNTGHLNTAPATQVMITARKQNILFSGDRGNINLPEPYARPDDAGLENKADFLILESTYGGRTHTPREYELQKMDKIIIDAMKNGTDVVIPTISLDRPLIVLYEIISRLIDTEIIQSKDVEIFCFGNLIEKLLDLVPRDHPMWLKIRKYIKMISKDRIESFRKPGKKPRIVLAGGGFLPTDGSPAGAVLENALEQEKLTIIFPNYHGGPESNAGNLIGGRPFFLTRDNQTPHELKPGHKAHYISGLSGHADTPQLVDYAAKVIREKGVIFLNHGTNEAREALKTALENDPRIRAKKPRIILPRQGRDYVLKK